MPTYEYACGACRHKFEKFQSISASPVRKCPKCGKSKVRRLLGTGAGLIFKGSGFYITDYRSENYKAAAKSEGGDGKPAGSETKAGPDAKSGSETGASKSDHGTSAAASGGSSNPTKSGEAGKSGKGSLRGKSKGK